MATKAAHGQAPWAGSVLPAPDVGELPPPIPGNPATFSYGSQLGSYPWAYASWAGGYPLATYPGGGVLLEPRPDTGVMAVTVWWPYATALQLVRITADGTRTPVRGAYPLAAGARATRLNYATNPGLETGLNGYVPDAGSPVLTRLADVTAPAGGYVLRATVAGAGSNGVTIPTGLLSPPADGTVTVGWGMRTSARPTSVTLTIGWTDISGGALTGSSVPLTADQVNESVNTWGRPVAAVIPPAGAVTPAVKITAAGMPAGGTMDLDSITIETGPPTDATAFDGATFGAVWTGTVDLSASVLAPVYTVLDGECPLDTVVTYQVSYPGITGGWVVSDPASLPSNRKAWLTHPSTPDSPMLIGLRRKPKLDYPIQQGVFQPINRRRKVVVTAAQRQGAEGTVEFNALSVDSRTQLLGMFADGAPVLLRAPAEYHYPDRWMALATVSDDPEDRLAWQDAWLISSPFVEVEAPSALV